MVVAWRAAYEAGGRFLHGDLEAGCRQQARQRAAQRSVVIDNVDGNAGARVFHGCILHTRSRLRKTGLRRHMLYRDAVASGLLGPVQLDVGTKSSSSAVRAMPMLTVTAPSRSFRRGVHSNAFDLRQ
jgi:hypothetical protein